MDWIFDHLQIVVLIVVVIGSFVKQFLDAKAAERQARKDMEERGDVFGPEEDWEPVEPGPPPLVFPTPPPLQRELPPPLLIDEALLKRQQDMQDRMRQIKETKATTSGNAAATRTRIAAEERHPKTVKPVKAGLRTGLRSRKEIRRAVIMKEILDPPLGLR